MRNLLAQAHLTIFGFDNLAFLKRHKLTLRLFVRAKAGAGSADNTTHTICFKNHLSDELASRFLCILLSFPLRFLLSILFFRQIVPTATFTRWATTTTTAICFAHK